jgi:hypothetical protein
VSADSSSDNPDRIVVLVDLISSGDDSGNYSGDDSATTPATILKTMGKFLNHHARDLSLDLHIFTDQLF